MAQNLGLIKFSFMADHQCFYYKHYDSLLPFIFISSSELTFLEDDREQV